MFDQDIIFRRHAEEKLDQKDQPKTAETKKTNQDHPGFIHHPSGLVIKKKHPDGNFYFASISERQPRVPFEVLHFSSNYYRRENGIDPEWKITDPVINNDDGEVIITEDQPEENTDSMPADQKNEQTNDESISATPNPPTDNLPADQEISEVENKISESPAEMTQSPIPA